MLRDVFYKLFLTYLPDESRIEEFWIQLSNEYSKPDRAYHNLAHLQHLLGSLLKLRSEFDNFDVVLFALFYHDFVYDPMRNDNEEKSAAAAEKLLAKIEVPASTIERASHIILATKSHGESDHDANIFIDADLSILGAPWETYEAYARGIRTEYFAVPEPLYRAGRISVLQHFLAMPAVFKTPFFKNLEESAKNNIRAELKLLQTN